MAHLPGSRFLSVDLQFLVFDFALSNVDLGIQSGEPGRLKRDRNLQNVVRDAPDGIVTRCSPHGQEYANSHSNRWLS